MIRKLKGGITVFLSLIMLLILSLVCTVIEMSRVSSAYARCNEITYMGLDSTFSSYAKEVFEDYGIMLLWKNSNEIKSNYRNFINKNSDFSTAFANKPFDILGIREMTTNIEKTVSTTDNDGELIYNQIYDYMKIALAEDIISKLVENCNTLSQSDSIDDFHNELDECSDKLENMEASVGEISNNINEIQKIQDNPIMVLENMKSKLEEIINTLPTDTYNIQVRDNLFDVYKVEFRKYQEWEEVNKNELMSIISYTNEYYTNFESAKTYVTGIQNKIEESKNNYDREIYDIMKEEISNLNQEIVNQEKDIYNVSDNKDITICQKKIVENVINDMNSIMDRTKELDYSYNKLSNYSGGEDLIKESYENVCKALESIKGYDSSLLKVNYVQGSGGKKKNDIVEFVKKIKKDGILGYIVEGELSNKSVDKSALPSVTSVINNGKNWSNYGTGNESVRKALIGQYILDKFSKYTSNKNNGQLKYEAEYILYGKNCDKDNLDETVNKIVLIREGFNFVHLMKENEKRTEAYNLALAITGFTGMPAITRITQFLIIAAWAYVESVVDAKDLLNGYNVKLIKNASEWNLSISEIRNLDSADNDKKNRSGLSYDDYIRFLLFTQNKSVQIHRILDLIQMNIQKKYNDNFKINDCMLEITVYTEYRIKRLFSDVGFAKRIILYKDDKFIIKIRQTFKY